MTFSTTTFAAVNDSVAIGLGTSEQAASFQVNSGTFTGLQVQFECRSNSSAPWYRVTAQVTHDKSVPLSWLTPVLASAPDYAWRLSMPVSYEVRARCVAIASGSASVTLGAGVGSGDSLNVAPEEQLFSLAVDSPTARFGNPPTNSTPLALATAYQALDPTKPALVTVNVSSTASISLSGGQTHTVQIVMGPTSAVAAGTGSVVPTAANSNTGALTIGLNLSTVAGVPFVFLLPVGWYFAVIRTSGAGAGSPVVVTATDQALSVAAV